MVADDPKDSLELPSSLIFFQVLFIPLGLVAMLGGLEGASLYPQVITYLVLPASVVLAALLAWYWWRYFRARGFTYVDREGKTVQDKPWVATLRAVFLAGLFGVVLWFGLQAVLRCLVKAMPGRAVAFQTHVTAVGSARGCSVLVEYADTISLGTVRLCTQFAAGRRWVGEPVTAHESVGLFGAKLDRLIFDDVSEAR